MAYDRDANPDGFTAFSPYGGFGDYTALYGASQGQGQHKPTVKQLKHRLKMLTAQLKKATSSQQKSRLIREIKRVKAHLAKMHQHHHHHGLRGSSGPSLRGRSGPNIRGSSGPILHGSSGRSHHIQRTALKHFRTTKVLRQGQQQGEEAYSEDDSGELTDADLQQDLSADGLEDGGTDTDGSTAGWGNWGMGSAFGSHYVALYGGAPFGATPDLSGSLVEKLRHAKVELAKLEIMKKTAKGGSAYKKKVKDRIKYDKRLIRALEKEIRKHGGHPGHSKKLGHKDAVLLAHLHKLHPHASRAELARLLAVERARRLALARAKARYIHRRPLVPHGTLAFQRPGQIPMQPGPLGPTPPPGVLLPGQAPGERAFNQMPESGGDASKYFDTSAGAGTGTDSTDLDTTGDDSDVDSGSDTDWGEIAKWGLGIGGVLAVIAILSSASKNKKKSKSSDFGSSASK
jgi:hypothetical protein